VVPPVVAWFTNRLMRALRSSGVGLAHLPVDALSESG
jgi:hypothetical protein